MNARQLSKLEEFFLTSYSINWVCDPQMQDLCMNYPNKLELCNYVEKIKKTGKPNFAEQDTEL